MTTLDSGTRFADRYKVVRCISSGGMGAVYEVVDTRTRRTRALKVMLPSLVSDPELVQRFEQEAIVVAGIRSDHIVETFDAGVDAATSTPYLVMELLEGLDVGARLMSGPVAPEETIRLLGQVALALDKTHGAGVIHRDLKPENLFIVHRDDGSSAIKILDFGVAKVVADQQSYTTTRSIGTPLYMPPEQLTGEGNIGAGADLYSLGHIAYTMLVGSSYWATERQRHSAIFPFLAALTRGAKHSPRARAKAEGVDLPAGFDAWFFKAVAPHSEDRFEGASEMLRALADVFDEEVDIPSALSTPRHTRGSDNESGGRESSAPDPIESLSVRTSAHSRWRVGAIVATAAAVGIAAVAALAGPFGTAPTSRAPAALPPEANNDDSWARAVVDKNAPDPSAPMPEPDPPPAVSPSISPPSPDERRPVGPSAPPPGEPLQAIPVGGSETAAKAPPAPAASINLGF